MSFQRSKKSSSDLDFEQATRVQFTRSGTSLSDFMEGSTYWPRRGITTNNSHFAIKLTNHDRHHLFDNLHTFHQFPQLNPYVLVSELVILKLKDPK